MDRRKIILKRTQQTSRVEARKEKLLRLSEDKKRRFDEISERHNREYNLYE
jgi:hypothetical protein